MSDQNKQDTDSTLDVSEARIRDLLLGMDNRELTEELRDAWRIINVLNMCEMDRGESYPMANRWLNRWEALGYKQPS